MRLSASPLMASPLDPSLLDPNNGAPHQCGICFKVFVSTKGLLQHSIIHTDRKPFNCEICGKPFRFKSNLFEHRSIHTGEQPYVCPFCGKTCRLKGNLKKHLKTHVKEPEELDRAYEAVTGGQPSSNDDDVDYFDEHDPENAAIHLARRHAERRKHVVVQQPPPAVPMPPPGSLIAAINNERKAAKLNKMVLMFKQGEESNFPLALSEYPPLSEMMSGEYSVLEFARAALGSTSLERYECALCELLFASRSEMLAHTEAAHDGRAAPAVDSGVVWCEVCLRPFDDSQVAEQHASYHRRVQLLVQTGVMPLNDAMAPVRF